VIGGSRPIHVRFVSDGDPKALSSRSGYALGYGDAWRDWVTIEKDFLTPLATTFVEPTASIDLFIPLVGLFGPPPARSLESGRVT
jgi:hypothetical protein